MMRIKITVEVEVERIQGKFAPKDEIEENILDAVESANPQSISAIGADGTSEYEVTDWMVEVA